MLDGSILFIVLLVRYGTIVNFVRYNIGSLEKLKVSAKYRKPKVILYQEYIQPFPVYSYNDQYMKYITGFYGNSFAVFLPNCF